MEALVALFFFILGTITGSFLNVVILRYNTGAKLGGRSHCFSCGKTIAWYDLVPVFSFLFLSGKCRFCKSKLSVQYPLVELITGLLFLGVFLKYFYFVHSFELSIFYYLFSIDLVALSLLVIISVYDLKHKIIPDAMVFLFSIFALGKLFLTVPVSLLIGFPYVFDLLAGPILALPIFLLWFFSQGRWIGLGDAKLALGIGWFLGLSLGVSAVVIGFWIGAIVGVALLGFSKLQGFKTFNTSLSKLGLGKLSMKTELPLAPFLIAGLAIVYFSSVDVSGINVLLGII